MKLTSRQWFQSAGLMFLMALAACSLVACSGGGGKGADAGAGLGGSMVPDGSLTSNEPPSPDLVGIWTLAARISDGTCAGRRPVRGETFAQEINLVIDQAGGCKIFSQDDLGNDLSVLFANETPMVLFDPAVVSCKAAGNQLVISQQDVPQNAPNTCSISTTMVVSLQLTADPDIPLKGVSGWHLDVSPDCSAQLKPDNSCRGNVIEFFSATTEGYKGRRLSEVAPPPDAPPPPAVPTEVTWSARQKMFNLPVAGVDKVQVAYPSVSGDALVVWVRRGMQVGNPQGSPPILKAARYNTLSKQNTAIPDVTPALAAGGSFKDLSLTMNATGDALVSWVQTENNISHVKMRHYSNSTKSWGPIVPARDNGKAQYVAVSYDTPTTVLLVWAESDVVNGQVGTKVRLKSQRYEDAALNAEVTAIGNTAIYLGAHPHNPLVLESRADETLLLWGASPNGPAANGATPPMTLNSKSYTSANNTWAATMPVSANDGAVHSYAFKYDAAGKGMVVWSQGTELRAKTRTVEGVWGDLKKLDDVDGTAYPVLSVAPNGNAMAAWQTGNMLFAAKYEGAGGEWLATEALNGVVNQPDAPQYKPVLATDTDNNFTLVWVQQVQQCSEADGLDCTMLNNLFGNTYVESDGAWQAGKTIASDSTPGPNQHFGADPTHVVPIPDAPQPVLAVNGNGSKGLLAWIHFDESLSSENVFVSVFTGLVVPAAAPAPVP